MNYYQEISGVTIVLPPQRLILVIYIVERSDRKPTPTDMQTQIYSSTHAHMQVSYLLKLLLNQKSSRSSALYTVGIPTSQSSTAFINHAVLCDNSYLHQNKT